MKKKKLFFFKNIVSVFGYMHPVFMHLITFSERLYI